MLGSFDTKAEDFDYLYGKLTACDLSVITIDVGTFGSQTRFKTDYDSEYVARLGGSTLKDLQEQKNREAALESMSAGAAKLILELFSQQKASGIIAMGGGGGTFMALKAMSRLPIGIPKICISTLASKDLSKQMGASDIILFPSVVDVAGVNSISKIIMNNAATALAGMVTPGTGAGLEDQQRIAISIFGNTTTCVNKCTELLRKQNYDVLTFHAVGSGGSTMESLILSGFFHGVMDITTTELADELCGGICSAGPDRLTACSAMGLPQIVAPGCLDMVNFGAIDTVPEKYKGRQLFKWAPDVTLMRTHEEENQLLGKMIAEKLNPAKGPVIILLPLKGLSQIGAPGNEFYNPAVDRILFDSIEKHIQNKNIEITYVDANINTPEFAIKAVDAFLSIRS